MFRRLQNILCCVVIAGFAAVCWYGKNNGEAVMTGDEIYAGIVSGVITCRMRVVAAVQIPGAGNTPCSIP